MNQAYLIYPTYKCDRSACSGLRCFEPGVVHVEHKKRLPAVFAQAGICFFFAGEFVKMIKIVCEFLKTILFVIRRKKIVRELVKIVKFARQFVNSCIFLIFKILFLKLLNTPFFSS